MSLWAGAGAWVIEVLVLAALAAVAHTASHAGQIVLLGKTLRGAEWTTLTIPRSGRPG